MAAFCGTSCYLCNLENVSFWFSDSSSGFASPSLSNEESLKTNRLHIWKLTHMFSQLCHVGVTFSAGSLRSRLIRWGRGGVVATNRGRRHKLAMRTPKRGGLLPSRGRPIAGGWGTGVRRGGGGGWDRRWIHCDPVCYPLAYLKKNKTKQRSNDEEFKK